MKIITVNLKISYIKTIELLVGENGLYPSRCELIRVAIRDFLLKELEIAKTMPIFEEKKPEPIQQNDELVVQVPYEEGLRTYRIVRK